MQKHKKGKNTQSHTKNKLYLKKKNSLMINADRCKKKPRSTVVL